MESRSNSEHVIRFIIFSPTLFCYTDMVKQVITECCFLKVNYEFMVDWWQHTDYLRCNPKFYGTPHFDCVFIQMTDKVIFGRLLFLFECAVGDITLSSALIHPFDALTGIWLRKDKHLNFYRVWARPHTQAEFFSVRSIICGAFLMLDGSTDYLVVDTDMCYDWDWSSYQSPNGQSAVSLIDKSLLSNERIKDLG